MLCNDVWNLIIEYLDLFDLITINSLCKKFVDLSFKNKERWDLYFEIRKLYENNKYYKILKIASFNNELGFLKYLLSKEEELSYRMIKRISFSRYIIYGATKSNNMKLLDALNIIPEGPGFNQALAETNKTDPKYYFDFHSVKAWIKTGDFDKFSTWISNELYYHTELIATSFNVYMKWIIKNNRLNFLEFIMNKFYNSNYHIIYDKINYDCEYLYKMMNKEMRKIFLKFVHIDTFDTKFLLECGECKLLLNRANNLIELTNLIAICKPENKKFINLVLNKIKLLCNI